jgi:hypothetical protein
MVCRLCKPLYGLKQSAHNWNQKLHQVLTDMGFQRLQSDRAVYVYTHGDCCIIVPVFIDDITLAGTTEKENDKVVAELRKHFKLRDLGTTEFLLSIAITHNWEKGTISLSQCQYILNILEHFGMSDCKPVYIPIDPGTPLTKDMCPKTEDAIMEMQSVPYLQAVGSLMYLATTTRPDISYAVGVLA